MQLLFHIGTEKTGTTSLQAFLRANRSMLKEHGILYPRAPGEVNHTALAAASQATARGGMAKLHNLQNKDDLDRFRSDLNTRLTDELRTANCGTVILSNEHCTSRLVTAEEVQFLHDFLAPHFTSMRLFVYLRRQDDYLLSTYSTTVKVGGVQPLEYPPPKLIKRRYDHWELLSRWASIFGRENITCRRFDKRMLVKADIVPDFLDATGVDPTLKFRRPKDLNESLDAEMLEFLRLFNKYAVPIRRRKLVQFLSERSHGPLLDLPEDQRAKLMAVVREGNARVAEEYFGGTLTGSDDPLFLSRPTDRPRTSKMELGLERAIAIGAELWQWQEKRAEDARDEEPSEGPAEGAVPDVVLEEG